MNIKAKLASLAAVAIIVGTQYPIASNADQPTLQAGDYIVVFDNQANEQAEAAKLRGQGAKVRFTYSSVFKGFAGTFNSAQLTALQKNPRVQSIEADGVMSVDAGSPQTPTPSWGLDRIDQRNLGLDNSYTYNTDAANVFAYVIDTGIDSKNSDFGGRVSNLGYTAIADGNGTDGCATGSAGHGTHVAGTIGGSKFGVAKNVKLVPVRVLDCNGSGTTSGVIAGINWVAANFKSFGPLAVANMSLGGGKSSTLNTAVNNLFASGVTIAVAAGNNGRDACQFSPASALSAITVGATTSTDARASYSNYGSCLDIFAPGSGITSDLPGDTTGTWDGTSMATPHVTGVAALYLSLNPTKTPSDVVSAIKNSATPNKVKSAGKNSPTSLLYSLIP